MAAYGIDPREVPPSFRPFAEAILARSGADDATMAEALVTLLGTVGEKAPAGEARAFALLLRRALPLSARLMQVSDVYIRPRYPLWYIRAVNDRQRNAAYRRAIETLVRPGMVVLEAGTGSGLFAMMAARAGAAHVYACEADAQVARIARANIARNGLNESITVLDCRYEDVRLDEHLPRRAELVIHEFVSAELAIPKLRAMVEGLREHVVTDDAPFLPGAFATRAMLIADEAPLDLVRVPAEVEGFDLSQINCLAPAGASLAPPVCIEGPLSAPFTLARLEMTTVPDETCGTRCIEVPVTADGAATGLVQWVRHEFPDGTVYENAPGRICHWWPNFRPFPAPVAVRQGTALALRLTVTESEVFADPDEGCAP